MSQLQHLSLSETITKVDALLDGGSGDPGRLYHILEFLKNNKPLYHSDKIYLEKKLDSSFSVEDEPEEENILLPKIKELIDSGNGDLGRLQSKTESISRKRYSTKWGSYYTTDQVSQRFSRIKEIIDVGISRILRDIFQGY